MYAPQFDYHRARSIPEALELMAKYPGAKFLAGGHTIVPLMKLRLAAPPALIDIGRLNELRGMGRTKDNSVIIGTLMTHAEVAASADVRAGAAALADAAALVGDPAVRNRGTIGGNVAHADPASDLPTALVALDASLRAASPRGIRSIAVRDFFTGIMTTSLGDDEILTDIVIPAAARGEGSAYEKFAHPASRYAVVGAAASITVRDGKISAARVAVGGLVPHARRLASVERALVGTAVSDDSVAAAARSVTVDLGGDVTGDIYASAEYRAAMAPVYIKRAVMTAAARASLR